jgi:FPC/CPF motif-containing protein YcgG
MIEIVENKEAVVAEYLSFLAEKDFPCIAAKAALARQQVKCLVAGNMACPKDDAGILQFLYEFVDEYRRSKDFYHTATIIFSGPQINNEEMFDGLLWQRLQSLEILDAENYSYDDRVEADPSSSKFSFSIKEEALYIIGLHPAGSRLARQFKYPALVFNPHAQFEQLRATTKYEVMKNTVRKRDIALSGSVNPMLKDFGESSEVYQYSGRKYDADWQCPLKITHAETKHNSST